MNTTILSKQNIPTVLSKEIKSEQSILGDNSVTVESQLEQHHLESLLRRFREDARKYSTSTIENNSSPVFKLDKSTFTKIIVDILYSPVNGSLSKDMLASSAYTLFDKIDWKKKESISWDDVCTYLFFQLNSDDSSGKQTPFIGQTQVTKIATLKDSIAKIIPDCHTSRLILITREGQVNLLSSKLVVTKSFQTDPTEVNDPPKKRRTKPWVTDCVCIEEINKLVFATANRDLQFYDMSSPNYVQQFHLCGLPHTALCLHYHYKSCVPYDRLNLFFGTDSGDIHLLSFHMANKNLFETPFKKSDFCWKILFSDIPNQSKFLSHTQLSHMHSDWVKKIVYVPEGEILLSCSNNGRDSLVYRSIDEKKRKIYVFKVTKGIQCFDYSKKHGLLATGSVDHILRLWDPYVTSKPMAILKIHKTSVIDVLIYEPLMQMFSYSKDGMLYAWDIKDHTVLQCINIKFPVNAPVFEHCHFPFCLTNNSAGRTLIVAAEEYVAELKLLSCVRKKRDVSHKSPVVSVAYSVKKDQIVSTSEMGEIITWSPLTGKKIVTIHTNSRDEVSAFAMDKNSEYAVTGFRDGSGILWNMSTGLQEKVLCAYSEEEITNVVVLPRAMTIFMLGWSKKILAYKNSNRVTNLTADPVWLSVEAHKDDIISAEYWRPHYLATGTFDGDIFIWNLEHERLWKKIQIGRTTGTFISKMLARGVLRSSRSARSGRKKLFESKSDISSAGECLHPPVEFLLYLYCRNHDTQATLLAVEGNTVNWWSVTATGQPVASFTISNDTDVVITAVASDRENRYLFTADSRGCVFVWDIREYALFQRFSRVVKNIITKQNIPILTTSYESPPLLSSWKCYDNDTITCLSSCCYHKKIFLLVGTMCGCVSLFGLDGSCVGMFHQASEWDLEEKTNEMLAVETTNAATNNESSSHGKTHENFNESEYETEISGHLEHKDGNPGNRDVPDDTTDPMFPSVVPGTNDAGANKMVKVSKLTESANKIKSAESYKTRSFIHNDLEEQRESWSVLGETYNANFKRRMKERHSRRLNYNEVREKSLNNLGGVSNLCSPFKALVTKNCEEYTLPEGLPITPKMISHSVNPYNSSSLDNIDSIT